MNRSRVVGSVMLTLLLIANFAAFSSGRGDNKTDNQKIADGANWGWSAELATPLHGIRQAGDVYDVRLISEHKNRSQLRIEVWAGDRLAYSWIGHANSVFRIQRDRLYYANFHPGAS